MYIYRYVMIKKHCVLPVITTVALWQLMLLGTWCIVGYVTWSPILCAQVHELPQSHCGDNRKGKFLSWRHIYDARYYYYFFIYYYSLGCFFENWSLMTIYMNMGLRVSEKSVFPSSQLVSAVLVFKGIYSRLKIENGYKRFYLI